VTPYNPAAQFDITLVDMGSIPAPAQYVAAFQEAKERWEAIITGELVNLESATSYGISDWFGNAFDSPYTAAFDDIVIGYQIGFIDGPGRVLGSAGCVYLIGNRCVTGVMNFEAVDFDSYDIEDAKAIILHEMGHVLGVVGTQGPCQGVCNRIDLVQYEYGEGK